MPSSNNKDFSLHNYTFEFIKSHPELNSILNSELDFINLIENILTCNPSLLYIYDAQDVEGFKKFIYCNATVETLGYSQQEIATLNGQILERIIHPDDLGKILDHQYGVKKLKPNETLNIEFRCLHKNSKDVIWLNSNEKALKFDEFGRVRFVIGVAVNITETKRLQLESQTSERRLNLALVNNYSAVWEWDLLSDVAWYSDNFYSLLGYDKNVKSTHQSFLKNLIHPKHILLFNDCFKNFKEQNSSFEIELELKTNLDVYKWFKISASTSKKEGTVNFNSIVAIITCIHDQKLNQIKLKALNSDLKQFAHIASHDLKEPLNTIKSFVTLFKDEFNNGISEEGKIYLKFIDEATVRMRNLIDGLLSHSLISNEHDDFEFFELSSLIKQAIDDLHYKINITNASIQLGALPKIFCNPILIKQLFFNLISNGLKYMPNDRDPKIEIGLIDCYDQHKIYVKDNGIGIAEENYDKVFSLFKRLHTNYEYEGTGIGLANCKKIIEAHGGKIHCKSTIGEGTTFYITIPKDYN